MTIDEVRRLLTKAPRPALSDALLSLKIGPSNVRSLPKAENVSAAREGLKGEKGQALAEAIMAAWKQRDPATYPKAA